MLLLSLNWCCEAVKGVCFHNVSKIPALFYLVPFHEFKQLENENRTIIHLNYNLSFSMCHYYVIVSLRYLRCLSCSAWYGIETITEYSCFDAYHPLTQHHHNTHIQPI